MTVCRMKGLDFDKEQKAPDSLRTESEKPEVKNNLFYFCSNLKLYILECHDKLIIK